MSLQKSTANIGVIVGDYTIVTIDREKPYKMVRFKRLTKISQWLKPLINSLKRFLLFYHGCLLLEDYIETNAKRRKL